MAQWEDLTPEQQQITNDWMSHLLRPAAGELARVLYHLDITKAAYVGPADVTTILDSLDDNAIIPNHTALAGAVPVTKAQLVPMLTTLAELLLAYYTTTHLERYIALAGPANVIGR